MILVMCVLYIIGTVTYWNEVCSEKCIPKMEADGIPGEFRIFHLFLLEHNFIDRLLFFSLSFSVWFCNLTCDPWISWSLFNVIVHTVWVIPLLACQLYQVNVYDFKIFKFSRNL